MKIEDISESVKWLNDLHEKYLLNPTPRELMSFLSNVGSAKGLTTDETFYVWDAMFAAHDDFKEIMKDYLGDEDKVTGHVVLSTTLGDTFDDYTDKPKEVSLSGTKIFALIDHELNHPRVKQAGITLI